MQAKGDDLNAAAKFLTQLGEFVGGLVVAFTGAYIGFDRLKKWSDAKALKLQQEGKEPQGTLQMLGTIRLELLQHDQRTTDNANHLQSLDKKVEDLSIQMGRIDERSIANKEALERNEKSLVRVEETANRIWQVMASGGHRP